MAIINAIDKWPTFSAITDKDGPRITGTRVKAKGRVGMRRMKRMSMADWNVRFDGRSRMKKKNKALLPPTGPWVSEINNIFFVAQGRPTDCVV